MPKTRATISKDPIVQDGDPVLRQKAKPLSLSEIKSAETQKLIERMKKLLAAEEYGVGLAAPQVGESLRLFIIAGRVFASPDGEDEEDDTDTKKKIPPPPDRVFINPEIARTSKTKSNMSEGCLSVRGWYGSVPRADKATVKALDENGKPFTLHGNGLLAQIFQHEFDHLDGVLYCDKATHMEISQEKDEEEADEKKVSKPRKTTTRR